MALEIHIEEDYTMYTKKVWVMEKLGSDIVYFNIDKDGKIVETRQTPNDLPVQDDKKFKPFMVMPREFGQAFLLEFTRVLTNMGIRTDNEHEMEGKLKATEKHLEDMQKIVFKQLKIEQ